MALGFFLEIDYQYSQKTRLFVPKFNDTVLFRLIYVRLLLFVQCRFALFKFLPNARELARKPNPAGLSCALGETALGEK